jgi:hypothetical protein
MTPNEFSLHRFDLAVIVGMYLTTSRPVPKNLPQWNGMHSAAIYRIYELSETPEFMAADGDGLEVLADFLAEQYMETPLGWDKAFHSLPDNLVALGEISPRWYHDHYA